MNRVRGSNSLVVIRAKARTQSYEGTARGSGFPLLRGDGYGRRMPGGLADAIDPRQASQTLDRIKILFAQIEAIANSSAYMPKQKDFIREHCAA